MFRFFFENRGAISVFMCIILLPTLVFGCLVLDGTRILGSKSIISGAGDLTMNGALSNYDPNLKDMYGLMGMQDVSSSDLSQYFENTLNASTIDHSGQTGSYSNFIQLDVTSFNLKGVNNSQVCKPGVMTQQILEYSKFRMPIAMGDELLDRLKELANKTKTSDAVSKQMKVAELSGDLYDLAQELKQKLEDHNEWCRKKPTHTEIDEMERKISQCYWKVSAMLIIQDSISNGPIETPSGTTEEKINGFLNALRNTNLDTHSPERDFSSIMAALAYQRSITPSDLREMVSSAASDEEEERLTALKESYENKALYIDRYRTNVNNELDVNIREAYHLLNEYYEVAVQAISTAEEARTSLQSIMNKLDHEIADAMSEWRISIDAMESGSEKDKVEDNYTKYETLFKKESLEDMDECLSENIDYFRKLQDYLNSFKFCDVVLRENSDPYRTYVTVLEGSSDSTYRFRGERYTNGSLEGKTDSFLRDKYTHGNYDYMVNGMAYNNINEHPYFLELEEMFKESNQQQVDGKMDELNQILTSEIRRLAEIADLQNADWSGNIPSEWLSQSGAESSSEDMSVNGMSDKNYKQMAADSRAALAQAGGMLQRLSEALERGLEAVYIMEYAVQMFSYYTVDVDSEGNTVNADEIHSLSDYKFSNETTAMYKSEVEYILWGNRTAKNNVEYTVATIFGIRFLLNCLYAFTSSELLTETGNIAAFAGPAAPVVQVALLVAVSVIESYRDVADLISGKGVVLLKNRNTWRTSLSGWLGGLGSADDTMKFYYKDYLRVFVLTNEIISTEKVLARMADCMQLNLRKAGSSPLDMTQSYTMVALNADVAVNTTFMDMVPRLANQSVSGNINRYQVHYKSVLAY